MKICDLTQFYSPTSGGVKRYVAEKLHYLRTRTEDDSHLLIVPGGRDEVVHGERATTCFIESPLLSRTSRYRALLRLEAVEQILERERPDIIETGDPYQVGWQAVRSGAVLGIPVVGYYHSHFPEAYLRTAERFCGPKVTALALALARAYVRALYNRLERTIVPSPALGEVLKGWGVRNVVHQDLGVDAAVFQPKPAPGEDVYGELGIPRDRILLLYVGRLAQEKNTHTLFDAFRGLPPGRFHLLVVGDGLQRAQVKQLREQTGAVTWLPYCSDANRLAAIYRAADLFVHPGVQETFGLVALEAQACGTAVIGIRGSFLDRLIFSSQILWAKKNTAAALARAIVEGAASVVARSPLAGRFRAQLHARATTQFSWQATFDGLFQLYRSVIEQYHRP